MPRNRFDTTARERINKPYHLEMVRPHSHDEIDSLELLLSISHSVTDTWGTGMVSSQAPTLGQPIRHSGSGSLNINELLDFHVLWPSTDVLPHTSQHLLVAILSPLLTFTPYLFPRRSTQRQLPSSLTGTSRT